MRNRLNTTGLRAGFGHASITPALGTALMGYPDAGGQRRAAAVRDGLRATALVLEQHGARWVWVSLDLCVLGDEPARAARRRIARAARTTMERTVVSVTHSHSAPCTAEFWGWSAVDTGYVRSVLLPAVTTAVTRAVAALIPVRLGVGTVTSEVGINRRAVQPDGTVILGQNPTGPVDATLTVARFEGARGPVGCVAHYGAHPTVLAAESRVVSRDWPGMMVDALEHYSGAPALFLNGALGDVAPRTSSGWATGDGTEFSLWEAGGRAIHDAVRAWRAAREFQPVELRTQSAVVALPYRPLPERVVARRELAAASAERNEPGAGMCRYRHWQAVVAAAGRRGRAAYRYRTTVWAVGPVAFAPMPGEPFAEIGLRLRAASPFPHTLPVSLTNGYAGYFCTREAVARGGYEAWVGQALGPRLLAENADDAVVGQYARLLQALAKEKST